MTTVVNMAYVPKPESWTKVLKMTPPSNGSADIALTSEKQKRQPFWSAYRLLEGNILSKYNILQENDHAPPQVNC
jgi:hypothetical protein